MKVVPVVKEIEELEATLRTAILAGDVSELDRLIGEAATYTNQSGRRVSKSADLAAYRSGLKVEKFDLVDDIIVKSLGDTVVVSLTADVAGYFGEDSFSARLAYTRIWHRRDGIWRIEAAHSSVVASDR